jgi:hypothetical protein
MNIALRTKPLTYELLGDTSYQTTTLDKGTSEKALPCISEEKKN